MRWSYLLPRILLLSLVWAFFAFAFDPMLRRTFTYSARRTTGMRVNVGELTTSFFPPAIELARVSVPSRRSPDRNLLQFDTIRATLAGRPLMKRSFVVREGRMTGLRWGDSRDLSEYTDLWEPEFGWMGPLLDSVAEKANSLGTQAVSHSLDQAKRQLDPRQLESVQLAQELEHVWRDRFDRMQRRIESLEDRVDAIEKRVEQKGNALERIAAYQQAAFEAGQLLNEAEQIRRELARLPITADEDLRRIDLARRRDQQALTRKLDVLRLDPEAVSELLLGPELADRLAWAAGWVQYAGRAVRRITGELEPERMRGVDILFPRKHELPRLLIEKLDVSGQAELGGESIAFTGTLSGLTSDPIVYGRPLAVSLSGAQTGTFQLDASFDQASDAPVHELAMEYTWPRESELRLGDPESLALKITAGNTNWRARVRLADNAVAARLTVHQQPVQVAMLVDEDRQNDLGRALNAVVGQLDDISAELTVSGPVDRPRWSLQSNLGPQIAGRLDQVIAHELDARRAELAAHVDGLVREQTRLLQTMIDAELGKLTSQLARGEGRFRKIW